MYEELLKNVVIISEKIEIVCIHTLTLIIIKFDNYASFAIFKSAKFPPVLGGPLVKFCVGYGEIICGD